MPGVPQAGRGQSSWGSGGARSGSRPGRAPVPWQPPGMTRQRREASWRFSLPPRALICRSTVEATRTQTGAGWKSRWPPRDARPPEHGGSFGDSGGAARLSLPGRTPRFAEPQHPRSLHGGLRAGMQRGTRGAGDAVVGAAACPVHAVPAALRPLPELAGLEASWESGARSRGWNRSVNGPHSCRGWQRVLPHRGQRTPPPALPNSFSFIFFFPPSFHPVFILF